MLSHSSRKNHQTVLKQKTFHSATLALARNRIHDKQLQINHVIIMVAQPVSFRGAHRALPSKWVMILLIWIMASKTREWWRFNYLPKFKIEDDPRNFHLTLSLYRSRVSVLEAFDPLLMNEYSESGDQGKQFELFFLLNISDCDFYRNSFYAVRIHYNILWNDYQKADSAAVFLSQWRISRFFFISN